MEPLMPVPGYDYRESRGRLVRAVTRGARGRTSSAWFGGYWRGRAADALRDAGEIRRALASNDARHRASIVETARERVADAAWFRGQVLAWCPAEVLP